MRGTINLHPIAIMHNIAEFCRTAVNADFVLVKIDIGTQFQQTTGANSFFNRRALLQRHALQVLLLR